MLARLDEGRLTVRSVDGGRSHVVDLRPYRSISSVALDPSAARVAFTAVSGSGREPDVGANKPGDLRLFVAELELGHVRMLSKGYAHDPAWFLDGMRVAFHHSRGVTVVDVETGRECDSFEMGRFTWGPPSVSVSPRGGRVAAIKWRGDDRKIAVYDLANRTLTIHRPSCFHYSWASETQVVYAGGTSISTLDVVTGKSSLWLTKATMSGVVSAVCELVSLANMNVSHHVGSPVAHAGRIYFMTWLSSAGQRASAVMSLGYTGSDLRVHALAEGARMLESFTLLNDAKTLCVTYEDVNRFNTVIHRGSLFVGEHAGAIPDGFAPLPRFATPQFGFHALPAADEGVAK